VLYRLTLSMLFLCACGAFIVPPPALASHAYVMSCCSVPSAVSVIDRATHLVTQTLIAGQGAADVAVTLDGKTLYVANATDSSISVLDATTGITTASISLSSYGASPYGVVLSPDGSQLYVTAAQSGHVSVLGVTTANNTLQFDVQTNATYPPDPSPIPFPPPVISGDGGTVYILASEFMMFDTSSFAIQTISIPSGVKHPQGVAITSDGAYAAVTFNAAGTFADYSGQFALLDLNALTLVKQIGFPSAATVGGVAVSPDGSRAYFPMNDAGDTAVAVFNIGSQKLEKSFPAGAGSGEAIAVSPDGSEIELGEYNTLVVSMQAATGAITAQTGTLGYTAALTVSPNGASIYVPNYGSSMIEAIDPQDSQIAYQIPGGWLGYGIYDTKYALAVSADGRSLALAGLLNVAFVDTVRQRLIGAVPLAGPFDSLALSPHGDRAYLVLGAVSGGLPQVQVIDTSTLQVTGSLSLTAADQPAQSAMSPDGSNLYISERNCPSSGSCVPELLAIDTATMQVTQGIALSTDDFTPGGIAISRDGATAYVEGLYYSGGISIVDLAQGEVTATISAQNGGPVIALSPDQRFIYNMAWSNYGYYLIDLATQQSTGEPSGPGIYWEYETGMALSPNGRLIYISSETEAYLQAFATYPNGTPVFLGTITLPSATDGVVFAQF